MARKFTTAWRSLSLLVGLLIARYIYRRKTYRRDTLRRVRQAGY